MTFEPLYYQHDLLHKDLGSINLIKIDFSKIVKSLRSHPKFKVKRGDNLQTVVSKVLNDKDILNFLAPFPTGRGLELGEMSFFDDIKVNVPYGLTLDNDAQRKVQLYSYEQATRSMHTHNLKIASCFPSYLESKYYSDFDGYPTPEAFVKNVNRVLQKPLDHLLKLPSNTCIV